MIRNLVRSARSHYLLSVAVAAILPGVLATAVEYYLTDGVSGISSIVAALAGGIGTLIILAFVEPLKPTEPNMRSQVNENPESMSVSQSPEVSTIQASSVPLVKDRIYSRRTPKELIAEFDGRTEIVAKDLTKRHLAQWLRVQGKVDDIRSSFDDSILVYLDHEFFEPIILLYFEGSVWEEYAQCIK